MINGWIKLHRKFCEWEWYDQPDTLRLFIHLLLNANHDNKEWHGVNINPGQLITGRQKLAKELKLSERKIRTSLNRLKSTNEITIESTNQYSIITICKWGEYQNDNSKERPAKRPAKRLSNDQQTTTNKNVKKEKKKYTYNEFYDAELKLSGNDANYLKFIGWLFGENIYKRPLKKVLAMQEQVSWKQFGGVTELYNKTKIPIREMLEEMENWLMDKPQKNKTVLGTLRTFVNNRTKK